MATIDTLLRIKSDVSNAVRGLKPLQTSLDSTRGDAEGLEKALSDLDKSHQVDVDDDAIKRARREIDDLQAQMRRDIELGADTRLAQRRIRELKTAIKLLDGQQIDIEVDVDDTDLRSLSTRLGGTFGKIGGGVGKVGGALAAVAAGITAVTFGLSAFGAAGGLAVLKTLSLADQMAQAKIAFGQFLGSGKAATTFLQQLSAFAAKTPFEFPDLIAASKTLLAFGIEAGDIKGILTTLGDAAALTGGNVSDLTTIWGQMQAKGKVANEELLQLTEAGIPAYQMLADAMGLTVPEIQDMATKGKLLSNDVLPLLQQQMDKTFGGGMAKQAETLGGKFSTFKDNIAAAGTALGEAFSPVVIEILDKLSTHLTEISDWASQNKETIALVFSESTASLIEFGASIVDYFATVMSVLGTVVGGVGIVIEGIGKGMQALSGLPGIPDDFGDSVVQAGEDIGGFGDSMGVTADELHTFAGGMKTAADDVRKHGADMARGFRADDLRAKIKATKDDLADLAKKPPTPKVKADIANAKAKLKELHHSLLVTTAEDKLIKIGVDIKQAKTNIAVAKKVLKELHDQPSTPKVKADITDWQKKLKTAKGEVDGLKDKRVKIKTEVSGKLRAGKDLDETANPDGEPRAAGIEAEADTTQAGNDLDTFVKLRRTAQIDVQFNVADLPLIGPLLPPGTTAPPVGGGPGSGGGGGGGGDRNRPTPVTQRPAPVLVYVDGEEVGAVVDRNHRRRHPVGAGRRGP